MRRIVKNRSVPMVVVLVGLGMLIGSPAEADRLGSVSTLKDRGLLREVVAEGKVEVTNGKAVMGSLRVESAGISGDIADDGKGTVVFVNSLPQTDGVVQEMPDGVRLLTVARGEDAPDKVSYRFPGMTLEPQPDGAVVIEAKGVIAAVVEAPWSVDAKGTSLPTRYGVSGDTLVQHVDLDGATYPVVSDPSISFGRYIYVKYSKSEVRRYWSGSDVINKVALTASCMLIPNAALAAMCITSGLEYLTSIANTFKSAKANNRCVELKMLYAPFGWITGWKTYSC